ncbi:3-deoxy-manno-octulosonate cytidylyltransferase [Ningiella sp. W23]|uniref:3-deoxy-manno-octulosonate cytidylyltransferase n=1 Tax=Ningiella sp. W23 TaxID=3023715 RepID=UPI00375762BF
MTDFSVVIPARYASTRFPGKPLALINNKTMLEHVHDRAKESGASRIVVATDDPRIERCARDFGADVCMTSTQHQSGTTRIAEVLELRRVGANELVINVQGDEPFIPPENIRQVADNLEQFDAFAMATLCYPISQLEDLNNPNVVKVVKAMNGKALYFSRASIPFDRAGNAESNMSDFTAAGEYFRHIGIYGYRAGFVKQFAQLGDSMLEHCESLEQLRVLEYGFDIHIDLAKSPPPHGVDTPDDLAKLKL